MSPGPSTPAPSPQLLDQLRDSIRRKYLSLATEQADVGWCRRFILFHDKRHPNDMGEVEIRAFPTDLAVTRRAKPPFRLLRTRSPLNGDQVGRTG